MNLRKKLNHLGNKLLDIITKKLGINIRHLIAYPLSFLYPNEVNNKILLFGSGRGKRFSGNSKALYLYLNETSNYHCIWMTSSLEIYDTLKKKRLPVVFKNKLFQSIKILKSANIIFMDHGYGDIFMMKFSPKTRIVHLAHGISFKKGGDDMKENFLEQMIREKLAKDIDYFVDSSNNNIEFKKSAYGFNFCEFLITGYPRNDILNSHSDEQIINIKNNLGINQASRVILYAPTFREYEYRTPLTPEFLKKLEEHMRKLNMVFLYKPHPFMEDIDLKEYENLISIHPDIDITDLLLITDILITDYSSVFIDFLLTMRPILFFAHDLEKFRKIRDFYYDYENFVPGPVIKSKEELLASLKDINKIDTKYHEKRKFTREIFHKYSDGKAKERIREFLQI